MTSKNKMRLILQAARTTVEAIERNGFKCMLVGPIAAYLHGSKSLPEDLSLVTFPNSDGRPTPECIAEILQKSHPFHFRSVLHQTNTSNLRYYSSISERENSCMVHLLRADNTIHIDDIVRLRNMPTAPLIHVLIDHLRALSTSLEIPGKFSDYAERPSPQVTSLNNLLLAAKAAKTLSASSNALFNQEAQSVLGHASHLLPQFSSVLLTATPFSPALDPPAGSPASTSLPTNFLNYENNNLAFINSLHEIDSGPEDVQLHVNSVPPIDSRVQTICRITKKIVKLLHDLKIVCALFGSAACWLYGSSRVPDDIDLLAFPPPDLPRERLKQMLQKAHPRLRLERPANPDAPFRILYFHLDGINGPRGFFPGNKCKIDLLIPGILHLPHLSGSQILHLGGLPVIPFSLLLLQKLQGWDDHRKLRWTYPKKYAKATIDARDLQQLLMLEQHVAPLRVSQPWNDSSLFTEEFMILSRQRVRDFCDSFPACKPDFELLGFFP